MQGTLKLQFSKRPDGLGTCLSDYERQGPLYALSPRRLKNGSKWVCLINSSGGLVGGDVMETQIQLGAGTDVMLTTQAATKVYRTTRLPCVQRNEFRVCRGALLQYKPDQVIPFRGSKFQQTTTVHLEPGARALLWELISPGRVARGERFQAASFWSKFQVFCEAKPVLSDVVDLKDPAQFGVLGQHTHCGSIYGFGPINAKRVQAQLPVAVGVSSFENGVVVRALANSIGALQETLEAAWAVCLDELKRVAPGGAVDQS